MMRKFFATSLALVLVFSLLGSALPAWADDATGGGIPTPLSDPANTTPEAPDTLGTGDSGASGTPSDPSTTEPVEQTTPDEGTGTDGGLEDPPLVDEEALANEPKADDEVEEGLPLLPLASAPLPVGRYRIRPATSNTRVLDIYGASKTAGANVQIYQSNNGSNQLFDVTVDGSGYYTIKSVNSGLVLDVSWGLAKSGTNVIQYTAKEGPNNVNQKWVITESSDSLGNKVYTVASALSDNLLLDVNGAADYNEANVQIWTRNTSAAQKFYFLPNDPGIVPTRTVADGIYALTSALPGGFVVDVAQSSTANNLQMAIWKRNDPVTTNQLFSVNWQTPGGFYTIRPINSAKALDVRGGVVATTPVVQYDSNNGDAQLWAILDNGDGSVSFIAKQSGLALDVFGSQAANGTKLSLYYPHGNDNQRFKLTAVTTEPLTAGVFSITPFTSASQRIDIENASKAAGARAITWNSNSGLNQKFEVIRVATATYAFRSLNSGMYLTAQGNVVEQQPGTAGALLETQKWVASYVLGGIQLFNVVSNKAMVLTSNAIGLADRQNVVGQAFGFTAVRAVEPGFYTLAAPGGRMVDVFDGSFYLRENVQIWDANGGGAQSWRVDYNANGKAILRNALSYLALDVEGAHATEGANVCQWELNGGNNQQWEFIPVEDGRFIIRCANGTWLKVTGGDKNGSNVCVTPTRENATSFMLTVAVYTGVSGNSELDSYLASIIRKVGAGGDRLKKCNDYVASYRYINGSTYPGGEWSVPFALEMYRNNGGNCYRYAALFTWLARALGYDARAVSGQVPSYSGGWAAHGWVEIRYGSQIFVCDPDMQHALPSHNWYWRTYANAPVSYRKL